MPLEMKYFVLKPSGKTIYAHASRQAMYAYAEAIEDDDMLLAKSLNEWAEDEEKRSKNRGIYRSDDENEDWSVLVERLQRTILDALDLIKKNYMITMGAMAVSSEIERSWRHHCRTTPELRRIYEALGEKI